MKKMRIYMGMIGLSAAILLAGCAQQETRAERIGREQAETLAIESSGYLESEVTITDAELDTWNGVEYYQIEFTAEGETYECDIDALTGTVIELRNTSGGTSAPVAADDDGAQTTLSTSGQETAGSTADKSTTGSAQLNLSGTQTTTQGTAQTSSLITEEQAKEAALTHAGISSADAIFLQSKLEWDDGRQIYDVEFYTADRTEYDYEIDASTGSVLSYDYDAESSLPAQSGTTGTALTESEAKAIALAQVSGASESDIWEFEVDYDDGRLEYEGTIVYGGMEYEFTIDGYSGAIRDWDAERFGD